jgi:hypothetical protein
LYQGKWFDNIASAILPDRFSVPSRILLTHAFGLANSTPNSNPAKTDLRTE